MSPSVEWSRDSDYDLNNRTWRELSDGKRKLSQVRHHHDLALRWFYPRLDEIQLDMQFDDEASDLVDTFRRGEDSPNRRGWGQRYCWLSPEGRPPRAKVMVWSRAIGWTRLAPSVWEELKRLEHDSVFADGSLFAEFPPGTRDELRCFVPRPR